MDPRLEAAVRRARLGDPRAFREVAEHLGPDLVRFLTFYLSGDGHAAHDVAQETFLRAWDILPTLKDAGHLRRWCYHVARCKAVSWIRRAKPRGREVESMDTRLEGGRRRIEPQTGGPQPHDPDGLRTAVQRAVRRLPPLYAGPVHLHYVQGCSTTETAELLGLTQSAVKMRLLRARHMLRDELDGLQGDAASPHPSPKKRSRP